MAIATLLALLLLAIRFVDKTQAFLVLPQQDTTAFQESSPASTSLDPVLKFIAKPVSNTSVYLYWSFKQVAVRDIDAVDIEYGPHNSPNEFKISNIGAHFRNYTITGLQPKTHYVFKLQPKRGDKPYKPKFEAIETIDVQNNELNSILSPAIKAETKSPTSVLVSWNEQDRGIYSSAIRVNTIKYYATTAPITSVASSLEQTTSNGKQQQTAPTSIAAATPNYNFINVTRESRFLIQKLRPATEYYFAVKTSYFSPDMRKQLSQSSYGSEVVAKTLEDEPSAPRNFTIYPSSSELAARDAVIKIELRWMPPELPNGIIKKYLILYAGESNADTWQNITINDTNTNNWFVENITPEVKYFFKMRAVNSAGESPDSDTLLYQAPPAHHPRQQDPFTAPIPTSNILLLIIICLLATFFVLFLVVSRLACSTSSKKSRKSSLNGNTKNTKSGASSAIAGKDSQRTLPRLNGFATTNSSSTVAARVGTLARRRNNNNNGDNSIDGDSKTGDFWISAMKQQQLNELKSNISEKSNSDINLAMVSVKRDSPQFATTQLASALPDYRFATTADQNTIQQQLQQSHYQTAAAVQFGALAYDQMDDATASALMTVTKRQQQQLQKYQIQFANTNTPSAAAFQLTANNSVQLPAQPTSPHHQPPPPPPLNIEQQQHHQQSLYGTHQSFENTRSLRLHRPTLYDPVSGSFVQQSAENYQQQQGGPPNYNTHNSHNVHNHHFINHHSQPNQISQVQLNQGANTLQFHSHQASTLSRRPTNTLRSFQNSSLNFATNNNQAANNFLTIVNNQQQNNHTNHHLLQSHQAVINQLNSSAYPSLPLKHVSAVRPQVMFNLDDQIELELKEKERPQQSPPDQSLHQGQQQQTTKQ